MKKNDNDNGMGELLQLLQSNPELIKELVFNSRRVMRLLRRKSARRLVRGVNTREFLNYVSGPDDGYPVAVCGGNTGHLYAKGTGYDLCRGGTAPGCGGNTGRPGCYGPTRVGCGGNTGPPCTRKTKP